jgi:hypothetical protein
VKTPTLFFAKVSQNQVVLTKGESMTWPFPPPSGPTPWTPQQIAEYQRKRINDADEALL